MWLAQLQNLQAFQWQKYSCVASILMGLCMVLFGTEDKLTAVTNWPAPPSICNLSENECNKFNCWDLRLSNDVNTVHVAALLRKLQQQEKVSEYLCTPPKRDLLLWWQQVGGAGATGRWGLKGGVPLEWSKKIENTSKNTWYFSIFKYFWRQVYILNSSWSKSNQTCSRTCWP